MEEAARDVNANKLLDYEISCEITARESPLRQFLFRDPLHLEYFFFFIKTSLQGNTGMRIFTFGPSATGINICEKVSSPRRIPHTDSAQRIATGDVSLTSSLSATGNLCDTIP